VISGRVQGVYFRQYTASEAERLELTGWVRNRDDGNSVEVLARGPRFALEALISRVRVGPPDARVDNVEVEWRPAGEEPLKGFQVR
jgi:acylphosphatase